MDAMRVAAVNYEIRPISSHQEFVDHGRRLLESCKAGGAELVVFPEFFTLELLSLAPAYEDRDVPGLIPPDCLEPIADIAQELGLIWVAGSTFVPTKGGFQNVAKTFWPSGEVNEQAKLVMTQFEAVDWGVTAGTGLKLIRDPRLAVTICYDCEFPEGGRILAERGALCHIVPAYTETEHGFWRVRNSCLARAIENQIFVIHASLVGSLRQEPVPMTYGSSAVIAPSVPPFPAGGVLSETPFNQEAIAFADLDFDALLKSRNEGDVRNWHDRRSARWE